MAITLYHHPFSRAADVVWMLEELALPYTLSYVDLARGEQRDDAHRARNAMQKLPVIDDDGVLVSERAAIGVYLADRYAAGTMAPALDDRARGPYLRWCFYGPTVVEPGCMAKASGWAFKPGQAGFGRYDDMLATLDEGLAHGPFLLGERFTMADVLIGGTLRWMLMFKMIDARDAYTAYVARLDGRPAYVRARDVNQRVAKEHGLV